MKNGASVATPNDFEVPADRPHFAVWPRRLPRALVVPETSLWFNLEVTAARLPNRAAYSFFGRTLTYRQLRDDAIALAGWLQKAGVQKGDRVAVFLQNCPQFPVALYAALRADAVVVPVNPMNRADEFQHYISDPETKVVICSADLAAIVDAANSALPGNRRVRAIVATRYSDTMPAGTIGDVDAPSPAMNDWLRSDPPLPAGCTRWLDAIGERLAPGPTTAGPDDLALLPYTSGTTGLPKGCMHTHRTLMHNAVSGQWGYGGGPEPVVLGVVPMFHITGMLYSVLGSVYTGSTVVVMPRWDRELAGRLISHHRISHWVCIPTMVIDLFGSPNYKSFDLSSLRSISGGGAAMPHAVAQRLLDEFGLTFAEGYGLTETAAPSHSNPPERAKLQCLGIPYFSVDSRVVDPLTLAELPPGEVGEIITRGPMVFTGYWKHPEATEAAFVDFDGRKFFRTGDLGRMDEDGYIFFKSRDDDVITSGGYRIGPGEIEECLMKHPAVAMVGVVGVPDKVRTEIVKAFVQLRPEIDATDALKLDLATFVKTRLAAHEYPREVEFVGELPLTTTGKIMRRELRRLDAERKGS
jgi:fatty-acyl-CoA synthase